MFEQKKIEALKKRIDRLEEENNYLKKENKDMQNNIESMRKVIDAAQDCIDINKKASRELGLAKTQYETALKEINLLKKDYKEKMDKVLKSV